jgi:hypothetical protein
MSGSTRYSTELRERAVRMTIEKREDYPSEWATFTAVAQLLGMSPVNRPETVQPSIVVPQPTHLKRQPYRPSPFWGRS